MGMQTNATTSIRTSSLVFHSPCLLVPPSFHSLPGIQPAIGMEARQWSLKLFGVYLHHKITWLEFIISISILCMQLYTSAHSYCTYSLRSSHNCKSCNWCYSVTMISQSLLRRRVLLYWNRKVKRVLCSWSQSEWDVNWWIVHLLQFWLGIEHRGWTPTLACRVQSQCSSINQPILLFKSNPTWRPNIIGLSSIHKSRQICAGCGVLASTDPVPITTLIGWGFHWKPSQGPPTTCWHGCGGLCQPLRS